MKKKKLNIAQLINQWTIETFTKRFILYDKDGKEIKYTVHKEK